MPHRRFANCLIITAGLLLATAGATTHALEPEPLGSAKGSVISAKGAKVGSCVVQIFTPATFGGNSAAKGGRRDRAAAFDLRASASLILLQAKGRPVMSVTTDSAGNFEIKSIKLGDYRYIAGNRAIGMAGGTFKIEAGTPAEIPIKLNEPAPK